MAENGLLINTRVGVPTIPVTRLLDAHIHTLSRKMSEAPTALAMDHDATVQAVIFDPAAFVGRTVRVAGKCVLLDLALGRLDIAANGAKLIVQLEHVDEGGRDVIGVLSAGMDVVVVGAVKKQQRRTFMDAASVLLPATLMRTQIS